MITRTKGMPFTDQRATHSIGSSLVFGKGIRHCLDRLCPGERISLMRYFEFAKNTCFALWSLCLQNSRWDRKPIFLIFFGSGYGEQVHDSYRRCPTLSREHSRRKEIKKGSHFCEPLVLLVPAAGIELAT